MWVGNTPWPKFPRPNGDSDKDEIIEVLSAEHGHFHCLWDPNNAQEVEDARTAFNTAKAAGRRPFRVGNDSRESVAMSEFDPTAGKMIILGPIAGG